MTSFRNLKRKGIELSQPKSWVVKGAHRPVGSFVFFLYKATFKRRITIGQTKRGIGPFRSGMRAGESQYNAVFQFRAIWVQILCFHDSLIARSHSVFQTVSPQCGHFPPFRFSSNTSTNSRHSLLLHFIHCPVSVLLSSTIFPTPSDLTYRLYHLVEREASLFSMSKPIFGSSPTKSMRCEIIFS
jgi:hypothetical protein